MTRRADRLFQIVQILRGRRLTTAAHLADRLGVSERTVYRDIRDLSLSGVPVEGEAGSGYRLMSGFDLPPLMLTNKESEALIVAIRLLKTWAGNRCRASWSRLRKRCWRFCPRRAAERRSRRGSTPRIFACKATPAAILTGFIRQFPPSRCWRCITVMKQDSCLNVRFSRWGCSSGESAGCWRRGVNGAMTIAVSGSTDASILWLRKGGLAKVRTGLWRIFCAR